MRDTEASDKETRLLKSLASLADNPDGKALLEWLGERMETIKTASIAIPDDHPHERGRGAGFAEVAMKISEARENLKRF